MAPESFANLESTRLALGVALHDLRARSSKLIANIRLAGAVAFFVLAAWLGLVRHQADWKQSLWYHLAYAALAAAVVVGVRVKNSRLPVAVLAPLLDVAMVFALQRESLWVSPFPAGVAGWSLGPFVLLVFFSSLTLRARLIYATAVAACLAEGLLQAEVGVGAGAISASVFVLLMAAAATHWAAARIEGAVSRLVTEQVRLQLANERSEELVKAHALTAAAQQQLAAQHEKLLQAQREAELLTSLLVHDMKGPLTSVLMLVEMAHSQLAFRPAEKALAQDLKVADVQGRRLLAMIHDLMAVARLEKGALQPKLGRVSLPTLCQSLSDAYRAEAVAKGIELSVRADANLTGMVDRELVHRALENLLTNALSHVAAGEKVELFASGSEQGRLVLGVRNTGMAVAADVRSTLFERAAGKSRNRANAGLGLYFCRLVAEAHGGAAALEEAQDWPVSFAIRLPVDVPTAIAA